MPNYYLIVVIAIYSKKDNTTSFLAYIKLTRLSDQTPNAPSRWETADEGSK